MRDFSISEIENIHQRIMLDGKANIGKLFEVLESDEFSDCQFYAMFSKIPMDDWDFEGAYFYEQDAENDWGKVLAKYGDFPIPKSRSIDTRAVKKLPEYDWRDRRDFVGSLFMNTFFNFDETFGNQRKP